MIFRPDAGGLLTIKRTRTLQNFRLVLWPKFCFGPTGFLSQQLSDRVLPGPVGLLVACRPCWLEAQLLTQVRKYW
jgi:hypothetical protein